MHKPVSCFKNFEDYASEETNPETNETYDIEKEDFIDDSVDEILKRELKEQEDDW